MKKRQQETKKTRFFHIPINNRVPTSNLSGWFSTGLERIAWQLSIITVIACVILTTRTGYQGTAAGEEIKCPNYCCIMFIKTIGVIIKHEGREEERILHSRTCELLENSDPHDYLLCNDRELALRKGFIPCKSCNLKSLDNDPCTAKCCKYYGWIIEPLTGILHRKDCHFLSIVKVQMYQDLAFICSLHNGEEELVDKALVERTAKYMICNSCFRDIIPKRYKLQPGVLPHDDNSVIEYRIESVDLCLTPMHSFN